MASFVVVLPALPVTPTTVPPQCSPRPRRQRCSAASESGTTSCGIEEFQDCSTIAHHSALSAAAHVIVPVVCRASQRKEAIARVDGAAVDTPARNTARRMVARLRWPVRWPGAKSSRAPPVGRASSRVPRTRSSLQDRPTGASTADRGVRPTYSAWPPSAFRISERSQRLARHFAVVEMNRLVAKI